MENTVAKTPREWVTRGVPEILRFVGEMGILSMMVIVIADVTMRSLFNKPILGALEVTTYWSMVVLSFAGMWLAQTRHEHISVTMLTDKLSKESRFIHRIFANILTFLFLAAVAWYGWSNALVNMARGEFTGATNVTIWPMRFMVPITMVAFMLTLVIQTVKEFQRSLTDEAESDDEEDSDFSMGLQL